MVKEYETLFLFVWFKLGLANLYRSSGQVPAKCGRLDGLRLLKV